MRERHLGRSGLRVSCLALGTMTWGGVTGAEAARDLLSAYLRAGGTTLDTAYGYGDGASEQILGSLLGDIVAREEIVLCTKAGISRRTGTRVLDTSRGTLMRQLTQSLARLGTDHVDLWLVHTWSAEVPLAETLSALEWAVGSGRARYVGVSNYSGWQTARALSLLEQARIPLVANQIEYSLLNRYAEDELVPAAQELGFGLLAWSPLGRGVLTGKYRHGIPADSRAASREYAGFADRFLDNASTAVVEALVTASAGLGVPPAEAALAWVRDRPGVASAVIGARTPSQLHSLLHSERVELPVEIVQALDDVSE